MTENSIAPGQFDQIFGQVAQIICETLELKTVSREDRFFEIGGHSMAAVQVVERINAVFDVDLSLRRLFEIETLGGLVAEIDALRRRQVFEGEI